jgi:hypothetical protein
VSRRPAAEAGCIAQGISVELILTTQIRKRRPGWKPERR